MLQKSSFISTTSFINSSNESLNKPPLSSSQSTVSSDYVTATSDSINQGSQTTVLVNRGNTMLLNQSNSPVQPSSIAVQSTVFPQSLQNSDYASSFDTRNTINLIKQQSVNQGKSAEFSDEIDHIPYEKPNYNSQNSSSDFIGSSTETKVYQSHSIYSSLLGNTSNNINNNLLFDDNSTQQRGGLSTTSRRIDTVTSTLDKINNQTANETYTLPTNPSINSFHHIKFLSNNQRTSINGIDSSNSNVLMPLNVKSMLLHGVTGDDVIRNWLTSIKCEEFINNFLDNGYDMPLLARMTPQDLTAIGCKSPTVRKKLLLEIRRLNLDDDIPSVKPYNLEKWLELLKLKEYYDRLCMEGYDTIEKVCELTWEDLEDFGITKLGHQKRLLLGIERVQKYNKQQEEQQNDLTIYDVHPNHRITLNQDQSDRRLSTMGRSTVRSGFFQIRPGANLDHRGLPKASVTPAFKYVNNSLANLDISQQVVTKQDSAKTTLNLNNNGNNRFSAKELSKKSAALYTTDSEIVCPKLNDSSNTTIRRNPPPLPPVRSNSLKIGPQEIGSSQLNNIYGIETNLSHQIDQTGLYVHTNSNSFLRIPKLGNLTATTNKMLVQGGHIQAFNGHSTISRTILPVREAPLPPLPSQPPPIIRKKVEEENSMSIQSFTTSVDVVDSLNINVESSLIGHQLASADEFPPPPPSQ